MALLIAHQSGFGSWGRDEMLGAPLLCAPPSPFFVSGSDLALSGAKPVNEITKSENRHKTRRALLLDCARRLAEPRMSSRIFPPYRFASGLIALSAIR